MTSDTSRRSIVGSRRGNKVNALSFALMMKLLTDGTRTCKELAEETGLHVMTVYDYTRYLHKQGVIHICTWEGEGRSSVRIFKLGEGKDAKRPVRGRLQVEADYRARRKAKELLQRMAGTVEEAV